MDIII
jgi:DNA mismatch repair protein MSH6